MHLSNYVISVQNVTANNTGGGGGEYNKCAEDQEDYRGYDKSGRTVTP